MIFWYLIKKKNCNSADVGHSRNMINQEINKTMKNLCNKIKNCSERGWQATFPRRSFTRRAIGCILRSCRSECKKRWCANKKKNGLEKA